MSLINKMLQDLDRRGARQGASIEAHVLSVARRRAPMWLAPALGVVLVLLLTGSGVFAWRHFKRAPALPLAAVVAPPVSMGPAAAPPPVLTAPAMPSAPIARTAPAMSANSANSANSATSATSANSAAAKTAVADAPSARKAPAVTSKRDADADGAAPIAPQDRGQGGSTAAPAAPARAARGALSPASAAGISDTGRQMSAQQRAENAYRRALAALQEGRVSEAIGALEQALTIEPGHDAARQTLVGLLIENKHPDEAMRQLQQGLALDARQPALAMLLARMQIERGESGIDTLLRSLPYAVGNADYHAFLAGALQRQQRHREAVEQYQAAVRAMPQNGVWLMGLGISLQADKRNADALEAFRQARAAANLSPELQAFVAGKVQQLSH